MHRPGQSCIAACDRCAPRDRIGHALQLPRLFHGDAVWQIGQLKHPLAHQVRFYILHRRRRLGSGVQWNGAGGHPLLDVPGHIPNAICADDIWVRQRRCHSREVFIKCADNLVATGIAPASAFNKVSAKVCAGAVRRQRVEQIGRNFSQFADDALLSCTKRRSNIGKDPEHSRGAPHEAAAGNMGNAELDTKITRHI